ncbi:hypothetical protein Pssp01_26190 [Pseudomonas sp. NBRC 100443]|nr:hypothetical protein Pssp01_26190 [Pseudomonas sp. NBRC 100443]
MTPNSPHAPNSPPLPSGRGAQPRAGERVKDINTAPELNLAPLFANGVPPGRHDVASKNALSLTLSLKGEGTVGQGRAFWSQPAAPAVSS